MSKDSIVNIFLIGVGLLSLIILKFLSDPLGLVNGFLSIWSLPFIQLKLKN